MIFWVNFQKVAIVDCLGEEGGAEQNEAGHGPQKRADSTVGTLQSFLAALAVLYLPS